MDTVAAFEAATLAVLDGEEFVAGYFQVYCEGAAMHRMGLVERQSYFDRQYADNANRRFYQFGEFENVSICGSSTYPCGSVAGTPGYMCASELLRHMRQ